MTQTDISHEDLTRELAQIASILWRAGQGLAVPEGLVLHSHPFTVNSPDLQSCVCFSAQGCQSHLRIWDHRCYGREGAVWKRLHVCLSAMLGINQALLTPDKQWGMDQNLGTYLLHIPHREMPELIHHDRMLNAKFARDRDARRSGAMSNHQILRISIFLQSLQERVNDIAFSENLPAPIVLDPFTNRRR